MTDTKEDSLQETGKNALASIREMVAALECDYDRLEELRDERDNYSMDEDANAAPDGPGYANDLEAWAGENPDDAEELKDLEAEAAGCDVAYPCKDQDEARQRIEEDALSVRIFGERTEGEWEADKAEILLTTGGPAVRIMVEIANGEAHRAWLEVQDWGTPWTEYYEADMADLCLSYAGCFYFGE